jgi:hypothetical protein
MSGICPTIILLTLGCLLLRNVRQVAQRRFTLSVIGLPIININQSFVSIPSYLPFGAQNLCSSITDSWYKSPLRLAWENVIIEIIRLCSYLFNSTSFYVSLLSTRGFRR